MGNTFKTMLGLSLLTALFLVFGRAAGGQTGMVIALILAAATNFVAYFFSDKIVLSMYGARELEPSESPELHRIVSDLAVTAGIPTPKLYWIPSETPNAFATGRGPGHAAVAVTEGITRILSLRELRAVLAHEIGHVVNRDVLLSTLVATCVGALGFLADMVRWSAFFGHSRNDREEGGSGVGLFVMALLMPVIGAIVQMFISRQREFGADEAGAQLSGDPMALASALRKLENPALAGDLNANPATAHMFIVNPLTGQDLMSLFSTHPRTADRVARLVSIAGEMGVAA